MRKLCSLLLILPCLCLSGCRDRSEIDDMAYAVAIGVEQGEGDQLSLTYAFADPAKVNGGGGEEASGGGEDSPLKTLTVSAPDIFSGGDVISAAIGKQVNLSHLKLLLFSKGIAASGIISYADGFMRNLKVRPRILPAVADQPRAYIEAIVPSFEGNPEKFLDQLFKKGASQYVPGTTLYQLYTASQLPERGVVLPILASDGSGQEEAESNAQNEQAGGSQADKGAKPALPAARALAVFRDGAMQAECTDAFSWQLLTGQLRDAHITLPGAPGEHVVFRIESVKKPHVKVDVSGNAPHITVQTQLNCQIIALENRTVTEQDYPQLQQQLQEFLSAQAAAFAQQTAQDFHTDICGFGAAAKRNFLTLDAWNAYDWAARYPTAAFTVQIDAAITRSGLVHREGGEGA